MATTINTPELASTITVVQSSNVGATDTPSPPTITGTSVPTSSLSESQSKPVISRPISISSCEHVQVIWSGGNAPYSLVAYAPVSPVQMISQTNQTSWSFYNDFVSPGNILAISVLDNQGINTTNIFVVDGNDGACLTNIPIPLTAVPTPSPSIVTTTSRNNSELPGATIVGIIFATLAFLIVVGTAFWVYRRKAASGPQRVLPYLPNHRDSKARDRSSVISGRSVGSGRSARSALSLWSTFSNRQNLNFERNNSVEHGVRVDVDTVQVVEEPYTPMTIPPTGVALFTPRRTTREWTGYGMSGNVRRDPTNGHNDTFNPSTIVSTSSIPEETTEAEFPTHQIAKPGPSPFDDAHYARDLSLAIDAKSVPIGSDTHPSEYDASQLSQRDLEALADVVAARLNQRAEDSPSSPQAHVAPNATEQPPRYC